MMITWFRRLLDDERLIKANEKLDRQYEELDEMSVELSRLCEKLDKVELTSPETTKARAAFKRTSSGPMARVRPEEVTNEEAPTNLLHRGKLPSNG
mgnify:CR=1 FL=1